MTTLNDYLMALKEDYPEYPEVVASAAENCAKVIEINDRLIGIAAPRMAYPSNNASYEFGYLTEIEFAEAYLGQDSVRVPIMLKDGRRTAGITWMPREAYVNSARLQREYDVIDPADIVTYHKALTQVQHVFESRIRRARMLPHMTAVRAFTTSSLPFRPQQAEENSPADGDTPAQGRS